MLLYTIVPPEMIFDESQEELPQEIEIKDGSVSLLCQTFPGGEMRISRIISSNPQDYLKPGWQPGSIVRH